MASIYSQSLGAPSYRTLNSSRKNINREEEEEEEEEEFVMKAILPTEITTEMTINSENNLSDESISITCKKESSLNSTHAKLNIKPNFYILAVLSAIKFTGSYISINCLTDMKMQKIVDSFENPERGQSEYLSAQSIISVVHSVIGVVTSSYFGGMSDRKGRVFGFLVAGFLSIIAGSINLYVFSSSYHYNIYSFVLLTSISSLDGSVAVLNALSNSYISDITSSNNRLLGFSTYQCIITCLSTVVPLFTAFVVKKYDNHTTLKISICCYIISFVGIWLFLGESVSASSRELFILENEKSHTDKQLQRDEYMQLLRDDSIRTSWKDVLHALYHLSRVHVIVDVLKPLRYFYRSKTFTGSFTPRTNTLIIVFVYFAFLVSYDGAGVALTSYAMIDLNWTSIDLSYFYSYCSIVSALVLLVVPYSLYPYLERHRHYQTVSDAVDKLDFFNIRTLSLGLVIATVCPMLSISTQSLYASQLFFGLIMFTLPTAQNCVLKYSSPNKTGKVLSAFSLLQCLNMLITPPIFIQVYSATKKYWPTLFVCIPLSLCVCAFFFTFFIKVVDAADTPLSSDTSAENELVRDVERNQSGSESESLLSLTESELQYNGSK